MKTLFSNMAWPSRILYYTNKRKVVPLTNDRLKKIAFGCNKGESSSFILLLINLRRMKGRGLFLIGTLLLLSEVLFGQDRISVTG